jgi:dihydrolipoamide dehydrogenase
VQHFDLIIIGAGPGGYVAAIRAAQLGIKTAVIEKQYWGGVCLNIGCIPSKCLLEDTHLYDELKHSGKARGILAETIGFDWGAMQARKATVVKQLTGGVEMLLKRNGVEKIAGSAAFISADTVQISLNEGGTEQATAAKFIIATGSTSAELPHIKPDGETIITSTEALALAIVPKTLAVIGAGAIGLELGSVFARLEAKVTMVEMMPQIIPGADKELADMLARELKKEGTAIHLESKVTSLEKTAAGAKLTVEGKSSFEVEAEKVLLAVGRKPNTEGLNLQDAGVETCARGFVKVDSSFNTSAPHVYAIGDVIGGMLLAHKASHEGIAAVEAIAGLGEPKPHAVPSIVYTAPELASVGLTAGQASEQGMEAKEGKFLFRANGRAMAMNSIAGMVKVVADAKTDMLLGVHILGPAAGELIHDAAVALAAHMKLADYQMVLRGHPTLAEAITDAALAADKRAIHKAE